jgi:hypothetical protein
MSDGQSRLAANDHIEAPGELAPFVQIAPSPAPMSTRGRSKHETWNVAGVRGQQTAVHLASESRPLLVRWCDTMS